MYPEPILVKALKSPTKAIKAVQRKLKHSIEDRVRLLSPPQSSTELINQKEIRIVGLKRTGNHAIINWIAHQQTGEVWKINDVPPNENPHRHRYEYLQYEHPFGSIPQWKLDLCRREAKGEFTKKDCLIYSYEDHALNQIASVSFEKKHDIYLGKTLKRYDLIILRDPFNLLASRFKSGFMEVKVHETVLELWISYAQEYLGETQYLKNKKICVNYNNWFTDINYRKQIASQLKLKFDDSGIDQVSGIGGGSSFDKLSLQEKASTMDVLNRWKYFSDNELYRKLLKNEEIFKYSELVFGHINGTEALLQ